MSAAWFLIVGGLLIFMGLAGTAFRRLPISAAMLYLLIGFALGPHALGMLHLDLYKDAHVLRTISELAVMVSLFSVGLRLRVTPTDRIWVLPLRLGVLGMLATIALMTCFGMVLLGLPGSVALLLGAMLSPTDPVLAHDVQIHHPGDNDSVRFALSGEGGLNDGIALPFVLMAMALLNAGDAAPDGAWRLLLQAIWGVLGGLAIGWTLGEAIGRLVSFLRSRYEQALGLESFLTLGLIGLSYGAALLIHGYGFLAVFAAGLAMRRVEHRASGGKDPAEVVGQIDFKDINSTATDPGRVQAYMAESVMGFTTELERIAEMTVMLLVGSLLSPALFSWQAAVVVVVLLLVARPLAVQAVLVGSSATARQRGLMSWFGIRGVGSVYYLSFAIEHASASTAMVRLAPTVLAVIVTSVLVHGVSAAPLMALYQRRREAPGGD
ncbi:MAG: cation:proton antiporter [Janthinobacterium lividum]